MDEQVQVRVVHMTRYVDGDFERVDVFYMDMPADAVAERDNERLESLALAHWREQVLDERFDMEFIKWRWIEEMEVTGVDYQEWVAI